MKLQRALALFLAGFLISSQTAHADSSASVAAPATGESSSSSTMETLKKIRAKTRSNYVFEMFGMNSKALSGNTDGTGGTITINHYLGLSYKLGSKWSVGATQPFRQLIDQKPSSVADPFSASDPYLALNNSSIIKSASNNFNLSGYIRYYAPVSRETNQTAARAARTDRGHGLLRAGLNPSKTWMDGALNLTVYNIFYYRLAQNSSQERFLKTGNPNRDDYYYAFLPVLSYSISNVFDVYLEYASLMRHNTEGKWTNFKKEDYVGVGTNITATPKLTINPYFQAAPRARGVESIDIGLTMVYALL
jgi:hypothetical protein